MKHGICENCMNGQEIRKYDTPFPSFTIIGGILGSIGSLVAGPLILIPAGLIAGAATDVTRCYLCGTEKNVHELTEEYEDEEGNRFYRLPSPFPHNRISNEKDDGRFAPFDVSEHAENPTDFDVSEFGFNTDFDSSFGFSDSFGGDAGLGGDGGGDGGSAGGDGGGSSGGGSD